MDALAPRGDEGRGKLRKAAGRRKQPLIRGSPNGATHPAMEIQQWKRTGGTETSKYPEEKRPIGIPQVAASERGRAQTSDVTAWLGL